MVISTGCGCFWVEASLSLPLLPYLWEGLQLRTLWAWAWWWWWWWCVCVVCGGDDDNMWLHMCAYVPLTNRRRSTQLAVFAKNRPPARTALRAPRASRRHRILDFGMVLFNPIPPPLLLLPCISLPSASVPSARCTRDCCPQGGLSFFLLLSPFSKLFPGTRGVWSVTQRGLAVGDTVGEMVRLRVGAVVGLWVGLVVGDVAGEMVSDTVFGPKN